MTEQAIQWGEWFVRQIRWRWPVSRMAFRSQHSRRQNPTKLSRAALASHLESARLGRQDILLIHAGTQDMVLDDGNSSIEEPIGVASTLLDWICDIAGPQVTLVMPTYPFYREVRRYNQAVGATRHVYNPGRTVSKTGLLSELFRLRKGAIRSTIPLQSLTALGPRAEELIRPFPILSDIPPHGLPTPHYRLCQENALVISLGVRLARHLTLVHVAEDCRFEKYAALSFYRRRSFVVRTKEDSVVQIWERRPEFARVVCTARLRHDLLREKILCESAVGGIDHLRAGPLLDYMMRRTANSTYPYLFPGLARPFSDHE